MNLWPFTKYCSPLTLGRLGIMGMNQRNVRYIGRYNDRALYPLVDNKLLTKEMAIKNRVQTTNLIGVIRHQYDVANFTKIVKNRSGFCIKPAHGSGGKGILVITSAVRRRFTKPNGQVLRAFDIERHISNILAGLFSLGGKQDSALIEDLINFDDVFADYSYEGVPDVRVIVFRGYPVMSMMRLSTAASDGKANLHQGAVGVGICLRTGKAVRAVQYNEPILKHPDTGALLSGLRVPKWREVLNLASRCYDMSHLGYIGTDIVLDKQRGPLLLELNARPGMAIQTANGAGLLPRLRFVEAFIAKNRYLPPEDRVEVSIKHFGVHDPDPEAPEPAVAAPAKEAAPAAPVPAEKVAGETPAETAAATRAEEPAGEAPASDAPVTPAATAPEAPAEPAAPEIPAEPETAPETPAEPAAPQTPAEPETAPEAPAEPAAPETPAATAAPETPAETAPEAPAKDGVPATPAETAAPETPAAPENRAKSPAGKTPAKAPGSGAPARRKDRGGKRGKRS